MRRARALLVVLTLVAVAVARPASAQTPDRAAVAATLDSLARAHAADTLVARDARPFDSTVPAACATYSPSE